MPTYDSHSSYAVGASATSASWSHTLASGSGNDRIALIAVGMEDNGPLPTSVTFDGQSASLVTGAMGLNSFPSTYVRAAIYYVLDADLPASAGTYTVAVTWDNTQYADVVGCLVLTGAEQAEPEAGNGGYTVTNTDGSIGITTLTDGAEVVDVAVKAGAQASTPGASQTERFDLLSANGMNRVALSQKTVATAGATTMSHTTASSTHWAHAVVSVAPASGSSVNIVVPTGSVAITGYAPTISAIGLDPPSVVSVFLDGTTATLEWVNASDAGVRVWVRGHGQTEWTAPIAELTAGETTYDVEWLTPGLDYDFGVSHFTATEESDIAYTTTVVGAPVSVEVPAGTVTITGYAPNVFTGGFLAPTGLTATTDDDGFDLAWTDTNGGTVGYRVEYRRTDVGGDYTTATITAAGAESYDLEWLAQGIEYEIRVRVGTEPDTDTPAASASATTGTVAVVSGVFG